jgi:hypothetical protein
MYVISRKGKAWHVNEIHGMPIQGKTFQGKVFQGNELKHVKERHGMSRQRHGIAWQGMAC